MSREGNCWDNAVVEAFFASLKKERIKKQIYRNRVREAPLLRFFLAVDPAYLVGSAPPINSDTPQHLRHCFSLFLLGRWMENPVGACTGARS